MKTQTIFFKTIQNDGEKEMIIHFGNQPPAQNTGQYMVPTVRPQTPENLQNYLSQFKDGFVKTKISDLHTQKEDYSFQEAFTMHATAYMVLATYVQGLFDVLIILVANMQPYENPNDIL